MLAMSSFAQVIDAFRQAPNTVEMGTKFEQLMVRYFELDPTLSREYDAVWRWMDRPGRDGKADTGIGLVARVRDTGEYAAIQCTAILSKKTNAFATSCSRQR